VNNYTKFKKKNNIIFVKYLFHISNIFLIIFYLYPGSILGCLIYDDCKTQPQLTGDFVVSSNHVYVFIVISFLGFVTYQNKKSFIWIIIYLFFISVFLELSHKFIPKRGFEMKDLAGNIIGVVISFTIFLILKLRKKNE
jgi:VanZ family protein